MKSPRKRRDGALEAEVLAVLWAADGRSLTPAEVNEQLPADLAYTTVMTVLTRLWRKGLADREAVGRGYGYRAAISESELAAQRIRHALDQVNDRASVLAGFVASLEGNELDQLRRLLSEIDEST